MTVESLSDALEKLDESKMMALAKSNKYGIILDYFDQIIEQSRRQVTNYAKMKLHFWIVKQTFSHEGEMWCDKIKGIERQNLFNEFLKLYKDAYEKPYDNYQPRTRSFHLENFKAYMMWKYRELRKKNA